MSSAPGPSTNPTASAGRVDELTPFSSVPCAKQTSGLNYYTELKIIAFEILTNAKEKTVQITVNATNRPAAFRAEDYQREK